MQRPRSTSGWDVGRSCFDAGPIEGSGATPRPLCRDRGPDRASGRRRTHGGCARPARRSGHRQVAVACRGDRTRWGARDERARDQGRSVRSPPRVRAACSSCCDQCARMRPDSPRRTRPCSTRPWASVTANHLSTFASRWPCSTCYRMRRRDSPLLLVVEDAHWLDQASVDVLSFVARRLESDPIVLLAAAREGYPTVFSADELPELRLRPLDPESATRLLGHSGDHLSAAERSRILREAAGNPLALVELPSIAHRLDGDQPMPGLVPLTERLERAFAARAADLPVATQLLLLVAALNDRESLREVLQAGRVVADQPVGVEALQAAADVRIVELDERTVRFRHPLMRSAVRQSAERGAATACTRGARRDARGRARPTSLAPRGTDRRRPRGRRPGARGGGPARPTPRSDRCRRNCAAPRRGAQRSRATRRAPDRRSRARLRARAAWTSSPRCFARPNSLSRDLSTGRAPPGSTR